MPPGWQPTLRDAQKLTRYLRKKNGVADFDFNPPTGVVACRVRCVQARAHAREIEGRWVGEGDG